MIGIGNNILMKATNDVSNPWDITGAIFVTNTPTQTNDAVQGLFISDDGFNLYYVDRGTYRIYQHLLSSAWDLSTISYIQNITSPSTTPYGVWFKADGMKMYTIDSSTIRIYEHALTTAWDISTSSVSGNILLSARLSSLTGFSFNFDGTKVYFSDNTSTDITQYTLSTAWNISTLTYDTQKYIPAATPRGSYISDDGTYFFFAKIATDEVLKYILSTPNSITTATFNSSFYEATPTGQLVSVFFKPDGTKMYTIGSSTEGINEYNL